MNVLVVEDEWFVRPTIVQKIKEAQPSALVREAQSLAEACARLEENPDTQLIILDLTLDDSAGVETLKRMRDWCISRELSPRIVVLSGERDPELAREVLYNHATGFILKGGPPADFAVGIDATLSGLIHIPQHVLALLAPKPVSSVTTGPDGSFPTTFTEREKEVCRLLADGYLTYKDVARNMKPSRSGDPISENTVRVYVNSIAQKLGIEKNVKTGVIAAIAQLKIRGKRNKS